MWLSNFFKSRKQKINDEKFAYDNLSFDSRLNYLKKFPKSIIRDYAEKMINSMNKEISKFDNMSNKQKINYYNSYLEKSHARSGRCIYSYVESEVKYFENKNIQINAELKIVKDLESFLEFEKIFVDVANADFIYNNSLDFTEKFKILVDFDNNPRRRTLVLGYLTNKIEFYTYYPIFKKCLIMGIEITDKYKLDGEKYTYEVEPREESNDNNKTIDSIFISKIKDTIFYKKQIVEIIKDPDSKKNIFINHKFPFQGPATIHKEPIEKIELKNLISKYLESKYKYFVSDYNKIQSLSKIYKKYEQYFTEILIDEYMQSILYQKFFNKAEKAENPGKFLLTSSLSLKELYLRNKNMIDIISDNKFISSDEASEKSEFWEYDPTFEKWNQLPTHFGSAKKINGNDILEEINLILGVSEKCFNDNGKEQL